MGILNVTPDSFSDGGAYLKTENAVNHGLAMATDGADLVDVGGESTRPGAARVSARTELQRVLPVVRELSQAGIPVSIDTTRASVAEAALDAGARMVNDVSGGLGDPAMPALISATGVPFVVMHSRGPSSDMQTRAHYEDVGTDVSRELAQRLGSLVDQGVDPQQIILDPGIGFAKLPAHNWHLLRCLVELRQLGRPLLVGVSRKSFLAALAHEGEFPLSLADQDLATAVATALLEPHVAWIRVHNVRANVLALRTAALLRSSGVTPVGS